MKRILVVMSLLLAMGLYAVPPGTDEEIAQRLQPFGSVCRVGDDCGVAAVAANTGPLNGEQVYNQFCFACHATGVSDAPRLANAEDWGSRLDKSMDELMASTLNGLNAMPPKGTCMNCSDEELQLAVDYMLESVQ
ncbi:MAG: c-type cytochrome [Pseudomonadales bacterium]